MIGKISTPRGEHVQPLLYYLFGPGRHEEHTDPHIVAGWRHPADLEPPLRPDGNRDFTKLAGPLDPNGTVLAPSQLVSLHDELGPANTLATAEPPGTDVPASLYNAYRATASFISTAELEMQTAPAAAMVAGGAVVSRISAPPRLTLS